MKNLEQSLRKRVHDFLEQRVAPNPLLLREPLHGDKRGLYKYRVGNYRIICEVKNKELVVLVIEIGHRREVYH
jgi:mRNA interferase RelE/StbE